MRIGSSATKLNVLVTFAEAEVSSSRWGPRYDLVLAADTVTRLRTLPADRWSPSDRNEAIRGLRSYRGGFIDPLLSLGGTWFEVMIGLRDLPDLQVTDAFQGWGPDLRLTTIVGIIQQGGKGEDDFTRNVQDVADHFDSARIRGRPVLVGSSRSEPFTVVEGTTRLAAILLRSVTGNHVPVEIPAYIGIVPRLREWGPARLHR